MRVSCALCNQQCIQYFCVVVIIPKPNTAFPAASVHAKFISITDWVGHVSVCIVAADLFYFYSCLMEIAIVFDMKNW